MVDDLPQVSQAPDPIANMPTAPVKYVEIPKDVSNDFPVFQTLTEIIKSTPAMAAFVATTAVDVAGSAKEAVLSVGTAPFNANFISPASPRGPEVETPRTPAKEPELNVSRIADSHSVSEVELGGITPTPISAPAVGQGKSQGRGH